MQWEPLRQLPGTISQQSLISLLAFQSMKMVLNVVLGQRPVIAHGPSLSTADPSGPNYLGSVPVDRKI
jgi:hypothetical protein